MGIGPPNFLYMKKIVIILLIKMFDKKKEKNKEITKNLKNKR